MGTSTLTIPKKIEKEIKSFSRDLGVSKQDFLINAVLYYFKTLEQKMELKKELDLWEKSSNEDFMKFEIKI